MAEINEFISPKAQKQVTELIKDAGILAAEYTKIFNSSKKLDQALTQISKSTQDQATTRKKLTEVQKEENRILQANERTKAKLLALQSDSNKVLIKNQEILKVRNKSIRDEVKLNNSLAGAYDKLNKRRLAAAKRLKNLIASEKASNAEIAKASKNFQTLDARLQKANHAVGQFNSNVGNYPKIGKMASAVRSLMAAFGVVGGIYLFVSALKDAFGRVKEFNKEMVNLEAVMQIDAEEMVDLRKEIIEVAGASTQTSNQVAKLASTLATLGKSRDEIITILKPVNDLSIGLQASSADAGELLVNTLNAFGEGTDQAVKYADVIAKMRTSTALDFERIQESLGYLAPTAEAAGVSIEKTGGILGTLVDNGIKATRAGRLMSSSFLRLAKSGKTLDGALDELNETQASGADNVEVLAKASKLFGVQSAGLGLILANNRDKVADLTAEFENSKGTLEELTNKQLESMDAKMKILDSSFERFILTATEGDNWLARKFKRTLEDLSWAFSSLSDWLDGTDRQFEDWKDKIRASNPSVERITMSIDKMNERLKVARENADKAIFPGEQREALEVVADYERQLKFLNKLLKENTKVVEENAEAVVDGAMSSEDALKALVKTIGNLNASLAVPMAQLTAEITKQKELAKDSGRTDVERNAALQKAMELQRKLVDYQREITRLNIERLALEYEINPTQKNALTLANARAEAIRQAAAQERTMVDLLKQQSTLLGQSTVFLKTQRDQILAINQEIIDDEKKITDNYLSELDARIIAHHEAEVKKKEDAIQQEQERKQLVNNMVSETVSFATELYRGFAELKQQQISDELSALDIARQTELQNAEGDAVKEAQINEKYDRKQAVLKQKQLKAEQNAALFDIAVRTGVNIVKVFPNPYLMALAGVLGLAQAAFVKKQKVPKFAKGVDSLQKGTFGEFGEAGRELVMMPGIDPFIANESTKAFLPKGTTIKSNKETEQILAQNQASSSQNNDVSLSYIAGIAQQIAEDRQAFIGAIENQSQHIFEVSEKGVNTLIKKKSGTINYLDKRFK